MLLLKLSLRVIERNIVVINNIDPKIASIFAEINIIIWRVSILMQAEITFPYGI